MKTNVDRKGRAASKGAPRKRRIRKKALSPEDGARAAVVAAALVGSAVILSTILVILKKPSDQVQAAVPAESVSAVPVVELSPSSAPAPVGPVLPAPIPAPPPVSAAPAAPAAVPVKAPPEPPPKIRGAVSFVIDDAGNNLRELEPFLRFSGPLTIAVLPGLPHSAEAARRIRAAGKEVFLHQPMESLGGQNPGPGAIYVGMGEAEIRAVLARNLAELGPVAGMNNHQGSKVTMDEKAVETILAFCRENSIYFLDSRTTAESVVPAVAARMGIRIRERDVFVDNIQEKAVMIRFIQDGMRKAEKQGAAVMIGHAWSSELAATLEELYPELVEQGFSLSTISRIMMGAWDDDEGFGY